MPDNQPVQENPAVKVETPTQPPVVKAEAPVAPTPKPADKATAPELDRKLPKYQRLVHFLESHGGDKGFVKINDFLKTFYPVPAGKEPPLWTNQGEMRSLKALLRTMKENGQVVFNGNSWERLGDNYHTDGEKLRRDYSVADIIIEARLPD